jgi:hypothetical protein
MRKTYFLVFSSPVEGREDEYEKWYDEVHLQDVLAVDGVVAAQRFDHVPLDAPEAGEPPQKHLALYELDGDPNAVFTEFMARVGSGQMVLSEALDLANTSMAMWQPRGERLEK